jgi:hypothetical protein
VRRDETLGCESVRLVRERERERVSEREDVS